MKKPVFSRELSYILGIYIVTLRAAFLSKAGFGMSIVTAPAYVLSIKFQPYVSFFTFGFFEYMIQVILLIGLAMALRSFKRSWIFSFMSAYISGNFIDLNCWLIKDIPADRISERIIWYVTGLILGSLGVSLMYHTYIPLEVYDIVVLEIADQKKKSIRFAKTCYDCVSCIIAIILSLVFFHDLIGVHIGTIICAVANGSLIGIWTKVLDRFFVFRDTTKLRNFFRNF